MFLFIKQLAKRTAFCGPNEMNVINHAMLVIIVPLSPSPLGSALFYRILLYSTVISLFRYPCTLSYSLRYSIVMSYPLSVYYHLLFFLFSRSAVCYSNLLYYTPLSLSLSLSQSLYSYTLLYSLLSS